MVVAEPWLLAPAAFATVNRPLVTVIVAVPLAVVGQIDYEPTLPTDRMFLHQRMPSGAIVKISVVYDQPFWRGDGLSGQTASLRVSRRTPFR